MEIRRLNTLRGLAAMIVVISHYSNATHLYKTMLGAGAGLRGVALFYILSGFLMSYLYLGQTPSLHNVRNFAVARIARIVPLFYIISTASFLLTNYAQPPYDKALYEIRTAPFLVSHLLFLHGESVLWTIPPEVQFYALFALAWIFYGRFKWNLWWVVALLLTLVFFFGYHDELTPVGELTFSGDLLKALPYFVSGSVMGYAYHQYKIPREATSHFYLLALVFIPLIFPSIFFSIMGRSYGTWGDTSVLLLISTVFFAVVFLVPDKNILLENAVGDFFGKISYSLYLLHLPILNGLGLLGLPTSGLSMIVFVAASTAAAYISFVIIESPSRKLIRKLFRSEAV